jgi:D-alanyl-D-alanine carboxypeptidase
MRKFIVFIIAAGVAYFIVSERGTSFQAHGQDIFGLFHSGGSRVAGVSSEVLSVEKLQPFVTESRELATTFQPVLKPYAPHIEVVSAHASIIMDADSGEVLYSRNADVERQIASLTKLFTATIAMERIKDLDESVTIDEEAVYAEGTRVGCPRSGFCNGERLKPGEKISARSLLKAALMNSANDAAIALGKHMGGTQDGFAKIMNERAGELGLMHSHFCTPSGLEPDGRESECYSSASDVAKIAIHALEYPEIWQIMQFEKQTIVSIDGKYSHDLFNTDQLLGQMPNLIGTKTGFTPNAGYSLLAVATDASRGHRIVSVVLDDPTRWQTIRSMFDWSFSAFEWK